MGLGACEQCASHPKKDPRRKAEHRRLKACRKVLRQLDLDPESFKNVASQSSICTEHISIAKKGTSRASHKNISLTRLSDTPRRSQHIEVRSECSAP